MLGALSSKLGDSSVWILEYLHLRYEIAWKQYPNQNMKFIRFLRTCTHSLKAVLYNSYNSVHFRLAASVGFSTQEF